MRLLLDTHCWLWMETAPERLSQSIRDVLVDPDSELYLSAASSWEIAIKYALGKLALPQAPSQYVPSRMQRGAITSLAVHHAHALQVAELPAHHRDPFDRLLIAQAQLEELAILTVDEAFRAYDVNIVWGTG